MLVFRPEPMFLMPALLHVWLHSVPAAGDHCRKRRKDSPMDMSCLPCYNNSIV
jgi:hypothetical protein